MVKKRLKGASFSGQIKSLDMMAQSVIVTQSQAQPVIMAPSQIQQVVVNQPQGNNQPQNWQTGLCDCCTDCGVCCCGFFFYTCLGCQVAGDMNECCLCGTTMAMRSVYRTKYNIPGSLCEDFCTVLCCPVLSLCQIKRDINKRRELGIF